MSQEALACSRSGGGLGLLAVLLAGCSGAPEAARFALRQKIPLGSLALTISHTERISAEHLSGPDWSLTGSDDPLLVVIFDVEGLESIPAADTYTTLAGMLDLADGSGRRYGPGHPLPRRKYYLQMAGSDARAEHDYRVLTKGFPHSTDSPREWVIVFSIPERSTGLTLLLKNLHPREGQPFLAAVLLEE